MRQAAALTASLQVEAYRTVVPGKTRDSDVARFLKKRMARAGRGGRLGAGPEPQRELGPGPRPLARDGSRHPAGRLHPDGLRHQGGGHVGDGHPALRLCAARRGRRSLPKEALEKWEKSKKGNRVAFAAIKPGMRGYDVDKAQRDWMREAGSEPVMWGTGHPVGYWAHDVGPALSGAQRGKPPEGWALRPILPGQVFAFDGFFAWKLGLRARRRRSRWRRWPW